MQDRDSAQRLQAAPDRRELQSFNHLHRRIEKEEPRNRGAQNRNSESEKRLRQRDAVDVRRDAQYEGRNEENAKVHAAVTDEIEQ